MAKITYRVDCKNFQDLRGALDHVSETHFAGAAVDYEKNPDRDGYHYDVFPAEGDFSEESVITIDEIRS